MSTGGGGGGPTETTVTNNALPAYAEPYYHDLMKRMSFETARPYQQYGQQRLAYFSPMEQEAMARYGELGVSGTPDSLRAAGMSAYDLMTGGSGLGGDVSSGYSAGMPINVGYRPDTRDSGYFAGQMNPETYRAGQRNMQFDPGTLASKEAIDQYMSPYQQNVTDIEKREAQRQADIARSSIGLSAAGAGSLGGYREAIEQAENTRNTAQLVGDIQHRGSQSAYENAQQAFEADRQARAQAEQFGQSQFGMNEQVRQRATELMQQGFSQNEAFRQAQEQMYQSQFGMNQQNIQAGQQLEMQKYQAYEQAKQQAAQLGLSAEEIEQAGQQAAAQVRLEATGMMGDFAKTQQEMEYDRLQQMMQAGGMERDLMQRGMDIGYQDFMRQQSYPLEMLNYYSMMLQGNTVAPGQTKQTFGQEPSTMQQGLGGLIAANGAMQGKGGSGGGG